VVVGLGALSLGVVSDVHVRSQLRLARSALGAARSHLARTLTRLDAAQSTLADTTSQRNALQGELTSTSAELAAVQSTLSSTQAGLSNAEKSLAFQGVDISVLNTCLTGVERALNQIAVGDNGGAVTSISAVSTSCQALQGQGKGRPVFPFDFPDPDVLRVGTAYYGYATNSVGGNIQMIRSIDLVHWTVEGNALPHLAAWARAGGTWAPGVFEFNGRFLLYYAAVDAVSGDECISVAESAGAQGPFVDNSSAPLVCQRALGGSLDPSPVLDTTGTAYLVWKSQGTSSQPPAIWSQQLTADGTGVTGDVHALIGPSQPWEGGVVEGPFLLPWAGRYYLFYSANDWDSARYAVGVAVCQGPTGPCTKPLTHALVVTDGSMAGPGGPALFTDPGGGLWMAFHAWLPSAVGYPNNRFLFLRQVAFTDSLPVVQLPG